MNRMIKKICALTLSLSSVACSRSAFDNGVPKAGAVPSLQKSWITVSDPNFADGSSAAEVTIGIMNADGDPVPGVTMNLQVSGQDNTIVPCSPSDENGHSRCRVYSTRAETKDVLASGSIELKSETTFRPLRPMMNSLAVVTAGHSLQLPGGERLIGTAGIVEENVMQKDAFGVRMMRSSILGAVLND